MKITIAGLGYVGLSLAVLLAQNNEVWAFDIDKKKIELLKKHKSPIEDSEIKEYLIHKNLNLFPTHDYKKAFEKAEYIIIATPTNYDERKNYFDTSSIDQVITNIFSIKNNNPAIIIKSTVPVGYTETLQRKFNNNRILFSPEFLREGKALYDNLHPSRIIVGGKNEDAKKFAGLLAENSLEHSPKILLMESSEAEAVKLFANTYLAMRIAYFNELDTYAELKNLDSKDIINGICSDPRIGEHYNNPSFGYGGYCLPKDSKQLLSNFNNVPQNIISAIVKANTSRKEHIVKMILNKKPKTIGIYRLTMKHNSDNFRSSAILEILEQLTKAKQKIIIYEPLLESNTFKEIQIENNLENFKEESSIILANRISEELRDVKEKVYSRDLFNRD